MTWNNIKRWSCDIAVLSIGIGLTSIYFRFQTYYHEWQSCKANLRVAEHISALDEDFKAGYFEEHTTPTPIPTLQPYNPKHRK